MVLGRPRQFNRNEALEAALDVFWTHGFEATSITDLIESMGINRGSLYDTFGDKESLFAEALAHYGRGGMVTIATALKAHRSPLKSLRGFLTQMAERLCAQPCRGCLLTNTAVELAPHNPTIAKVVAAHLQEMERLFCDVIKRAIQAGELDKTLKPKIAARFLVTLFQGMVVMAKAGSPASAAKDTIAMMDRALGV
jgi:TetR/AcrR family transcriptional repressor of nem operon